MGHDEPHGQSALAPDAVPPGEATQIWNGAWRSLIIGK